MIAGLPCPSDAEVARVYRRWRYKANRLRWMTGADIDTCRRIIMEVNSVIWSKK